MRFLFFVCFAILMLLIIAMPAKSTQQMSKNEEQIQMLEACKRKGDIIAKTQFGKDAHIVYLTINGRKIGVGRYQCYLEAMIDGSYAKATLYATQDVKASD